MAEKAGMLQEYDGFYKFHSKYVHPTSWLVNGTREQVEDGAYREVLTLQAFNYGNELAVLLQ